jgi:hypothetical protein
VCFTEFFYPILILVTDANYGAYTAETLKAENFNEYHTDSLNDSKVTLSYLQQFDIVILSETPVDQFQKMMLSDFVI